MILLSVFVLRWGNLILPGSWLLCLLVQNMYGGLYTQDNVAISGIHTHSGPGGYLQYLLYIITSLGFVKENYDALVDGVVQVSS